MLLLLAIALTTLKTIVVLCTVRSKQTFSGELPVGALLMFLESIINYKTEKMEKLEAAISLMQKICDISISMEDLKDLTVDVAEKQRIVDTIDSARCTTELERMKQIYKKVENGKTIIQGGIPE